MLLQALEHGAEAAESDDEEEAELGKPTYVQEQQDLKRSFLQAGFLHSLSLSLFHIQCTPWLSAEDKLTFGQAYVRTCLWNLLHDCLVKCVRCAIVPCKAVHHMLCCKL